MNKSTKTTLPLLLYNQFLPNFIFVILGIILTYKTISPLRVTVSIFILYYFSYFIHRLFHYFPKNINIHTLFHHSKRGRILAKYFNLFVEFLLNVTFFIIFYYIQKLLHIAFVPEIIIFYYGFIYTSVHIINYSIFHCANSHVLHHENSHDINKTCNYGPDLLDHLFSTNCNDKVENYDHILLNIIISFISTYYIFKPDIF